MRAKLMMKIKKISYYSVLAGASALISLPLSSCQNATLENKIDDIDDNVVEVTSLAPSLTKGRAINDVENLFECDVPGWRVTATGTIIGDDGQSWIVPAETSYKDGLKATDLFNECTGVTLASEKDLNVSDVPIVEIDEDGEVITGYFFGDNYFEFYVNGQLVTVDPVPYWPFNTSAIRFKAKRPFVLGAKMIDWSENLGLGSELMRGVPYHTGDGGFVAIFKDENEEVITSTDANWRVQPYYIAPLHDPSCVKPDRTSKVCTVPPKSEAEDGYGLHWALPEDWGVMSFDDAGWQDATLYTNEDIGGSLNRPAYQNFTGLFDDPAHDAEFIWSENLLQDNIVLARRVIE